MKFVSDQKLREVIRTVYPTLEVEDPDKFSELWSEMLAASKEPCFTAAAARLASEDPMLPILLSWERNWVTTVDEATVLAAFMPRVTSMLRKRMEKDGEHSPESVLAVDEAGKALVADLIEAMRGNGEQKT